MNPDTLRKAVALASKTKHVFVATASAQGWPHLAAAGSLALTRENHLVVEEWFCPGTVANLQANSQLAIVVWDPDTDDGYQILGQLE